MLRWTVAVARPRQGAVGVRASAADGGVNRPFTVALIGPDGAGKTTLARTLQGALGVPVKYLYMGVNPDASNHLLPTTRLAFALKRRRGVEPDAGPPDDAQGAAKPAPRGVRRASSTARSLLRLSNRLAEEWHRQLLASLHLRRGALVVFDRHFFADYYATDIGRDADRSLARRLHGLALRRLYPRPDLVIYLDAPPEVLLARKNEGTLESLARRRRDYLELARVMERFHVVDASRPVDDVLRDVVRVIDRFAAEKTSEARSHA